MNTKVLKRPGMSQKMKGQKHRLGKTMSEDAKLKRREKMGVKAESKKRIAVLDTATGIIYDSISHAAIALELSISTLTRALSEDKKLRNGKYFVKVVDYSKQPIGF